MKTITRMSFAIVPVFALAATAVFASAEPIAASASTIVIAKGGDDTHAEAPGFKLQVGSPGTELEFAL